MKTYEEFKVMELRPAYYNGTVFEIDVEFKESTVFGVGIEVAKAINMVVGDTVRISGKVFGEEADYEYISIYMCGDVLTDFIGKYGVGKITAERVRMKLEQIYTVYKCNDYGFEPKEEEITAYKLIEIIDD